MNVNKKAAVILCGSGAMDGSEIHESVLALHALDSNNINYQCFAIDTPQTKVVNCLTGHDERGYSRNQLKESARIARGNIQAITNISIKSIINDYDYLILPGGFGVAWNLCTFATNGKHSTIVPEIQQIIQGFHEQKKPIGALCIAPVLLALSLQDICRPVITAGYNNNNPDTVEAYEYLNAIVKDCDSSNIIVDTDNKLITTPAYMNDDASISTIQQGILKLVQHLNTL